MSDDSNIRDRDNVKADTQNSAQNAREKDADARSSRDMRSVQNILVQPKAQLRYAFVVFGSGTLLMVGIVAWLLLSFNKSLETLHAVYQIDAIVVERLQMSLYSTLVMIIVFGLVIAGITISVGIALSHRIFGPMVPIQQHIRALIVGNYQARIKLRKKDEFQDLMISLNELAAKLESEPRPKN